MIGPRISHSPMPRRRARGFTLVEAIVVIVITGIVASFVAVFVRVPVKSYVESVARAEATDMADYAMRRMAREIRLALPNSVRVTTSGSTVYLEFLLTKAGLRYLGDDDVGTAGTVLSWSDTTAYAFTVVGGVPTDRRAPIAGDWVVVYNLGPDQEPANAYADCAAALGCNRAPIESVDSAAGTITLKSNPFAAQASSAAGVSLRSPGRRFHIVSSPVTYACDGATGRLTRHWDYAIAPAQPTAPAVLGQGALLASNLSSCEFTYAGLANVHSGLVGIKLMQKVDDGNNAPPMTLLQQVHVENTP
ncbi:prepilin-type N-terminal cleavage/methylation domain-containing protein [Massilia glaciei]|uniref:Prepilin-type N-terminal cleavage/methylation domain-containing protein n=1 Tax=Massilia glaciei TaxID=1524097 RepID=A0A2U2HJL8_9BURK|nr:prepilin-type N-terminal cleavage/methylation domain-containing protein [Massilia glaciei]PWF47731.1 prepilin-type N-terminal cleavage/methylation domain-containing protein [Massilia glaciei]